MKRFLSIFKGMNNQQNPVIQSIVFEKKVAGALDVEAPIETAFHYEVSKESGIFYDESGFCCLTLKSEKPIYNEVEGFNFLHETVVPLQYVLNLLGFDFFKDEHVWKEKLKTDEAFSKQIEEYLSYFKPISKEAYESGLNQR